MRAHAGTRLGVGADVLAATALRPRTAPERRLREAAPGAPTRSFTRGPLRRRASARETSEVATDCRPHAEATDVPGRPGGQPLISGAARNKHVEPGRSIDKQYSTLIEGLAMLFFTV